MTDLKKTLHRGFDEALQTVTEALKREGFGVLTTIDVQATLREKLGADLPRYRILGACNPPFALQAIQADADAGLMMPCNVLVRQAGETVVVTAVDPAATAGALGNPQLEPLAQAIREKLVRVLAAL
jgi:uncharacterized protein (DUF302 family)